MHDIKAYILPCSRTNRVIVFVYLLVVKGRLYYGKFGVLLVIQTITGNQEISIVQVGQTMENKMGKMWNAFALSLSSAIHAWMELWSFQCGGCLWRRSSLRDNMLIQSSSYSGIITSSEMPIRKANGCIHYTCKLAGFSWAFPLTHINREKDETSTIASLNTNLNLEQWTFSKQFCQRITGPYEYSSAYCLAPSNVKCIGKESSRKIPYSYCVATSGMFLRKIQTTSVCTILRSFIQVEIHQPLVEMILLKILGGRMQTKTVWWATARQCNEPTGVFIKGRRQATCLTPYFQGPSTGFARKFLTFLVKNVLPSYTIYSEPDKK